MFSFTIVDSEVRDFMTKLLREEVFDSFEVRGVEIATFARFEINGATDNSEGRSYCSWSELRPYVYEIIKGKRPKSLKVVLSLPHSRLDEIHNSASACFLNLVYSGNQVLCTSTATENAFSMDRAVDGAWQEYITAFFKSSKITIRRN